MHELLEVAVARVDDAVAGEQLLLRELVRVRLQRLALARARARRRAPCAQATQPHVLVHVLTISTVHVQRTLEVHYSMYYVYLRVRVLILLKQKQLTHAQWRVTLYSRRKQVSVQCL